MLRRRSSGRMGRATRSRGLRTMSDSRTTDERERPVESGVSPGFSELDEVQDLELRQRVWRNFITSARAAGDPDVAALLEADIKLKDLDPAFATICDNDDVEFPPGEGECPNPK